MLSGDNKIITDDKRLEKRFNEHYIDIVECFSGLKPEKIVHHHKDFDKGIVIHKTVKKYEYHSSTDKCRNLSSYNQIFYQHH